MKFQYFHALQSRGRLNSVSWSSNLHKSELFLQFEMYFGEIDIVDVCGCQEADILHKLDQFLNLATEIQLILFMFPKFQPGCLTSFSKILYSIRKKRNAT